MKENQALSQKSGPALMSPDKLWLVVFGVGSLIFLLAEFAYTKHHGHVRFEDWFAFNALIGFVGVVLLVGLAMLGRGILGNVKDDVDV